MAVVGERMIRRSDSVHLKRGERIVIVYENEAAVEFALERYILSALQIIQDSNDSTKIHKVFKLDQFGETTPLQLVLKGFKVDLEPIPISTPKSETASEIAPAASVGLDYICSRCEEAFASDSDDGKCPLCRAGHLMPRGIHSKRKA